MIKVLQPPPPPKLCLGVEILSLLLFKPIFKDSILRSQVVQRESFRRDPDSGNGFLQGRDLKVSSSKNTASTPLKYTGTDAFIWIFYKRNKCGIIRPKEQKCLMVLRCDIFDLHNDQKCHKQRLKAGNQMHKNQLDYESIHKQRKRQRLK